MLSHSSMVALRLEACKLLAVRHGVNDLMFGAGIEKRVGFLTFLEGSAEPAPCQPDWNVVRRGTHPIGGRILRMFRRYKRDRLLIFG